MRVLSRLYMIGFSAALSPLAISAQASIVTFDRDKGSVTAIQYSQFPNPNGARLNGTWTEGRTNVDFFGMPSESHDIADLLSYSLDRALYEQAFLSDCTGCFWDFPSLQRLNITHYSGFSDSSYGVADSFSLDAIDIAGSYSSRVGEFSFSPEIGSDATAERYTLPLLQKNMYIIGNHADGSVTRLELSTFDDLTALHTGPAIYGPTTIDLTDAGFSEMSSVEIGINFGIYLDDDMLTWLAKTSVISDAMLVFLSTCPEQPASYDCSKTVAGLGRFDYDLSVDTNQNTHTGFNIDSLYLDGSYTRPVPIIPVAAVPLPAAGGLSLVALAVLGALRARRREQRQS